MPRHVKTITAHDMADASADGYRSHKEHAAPLVKIVEDIVGRRTDSVEVEGIVRELEAALEQYKDPK